MQFKKTNSLTSKQYLVPFILITSLFFLWGFARAILDVLNKHFQNELNISLTESAMIQVITFLGYFIMALPAGLFINRFGYRQGVVTGLLLYAAGAFLFIPSSAYNVLGGYLVALFVIACGLTFLETSANPYATELGPKETATSRLNLAQSFNGMGSALAPAIVGAFLFTSADADVSMPYIVMGIVVLVVALIFYNSRLPEIKGEDEDQNENQNENENGKAADGIGNLKLLMHNKLFLFGLAALLAYEVAEISINSYFINFTTGMNWIEADMASYILSFSLFIFMGGRFVGSWIMRKIAAEKMLLWCGIGSVVCIAALLCGTTFGVLPVWLSIALIMANYFCEAIMFPTIFSLTLRGLGNLTKSASSVLMMTPVGGCGFLLMAWLADVSDSLIIPFIIPLIGYAIVALFARKLVKG